MPSAKKTRAKNKKYYQEKQEKLKAASKAHYAINPDTQKAASKARYRANPDKKKAASKACYTVNPDKQKAASKARYRANPDKKKAAANAHSKACYRANPNKKKADSIARYRANPDQKKAASKARYRANSDKMKAASKARYRANSDKMKAAARAHYRFDPEKKKAFRRANYIKKRAANLATSKAYYASNRKSIRANRRGRYALAEPKPDVRQMYVKKIRGRLLSNRKARARVTAAFKKQEGSLAKQMSRVLGRTVCSVAGTRLLNKALQLRKEHAGCLLKTTRVINAIQITGSEDFGVGCHTASSEPYFFDASYQHVKRDYALPIDENGKCMVALEIKTDSSKSGPKKWECSSECKPLTNFEVDAILEIKEAFAKPMQHLRYACTTFDHGCPNGHYTKVVDGDNSVVYCMGHPIVCSNDGGCKSKLRILRAASTHYPVLGNLLHHVNDAVRSSSCVDDIDEALCAGDFHALMELTKVDDFDTLFSNDVESSYEQCTGSAVGDSMLRQPHLESQLLFTHAQLIARLEKEIDDFPELACCSCERLHQRKSVTRVKLSDNLSSEVWPALKSYVLQQNPNAGEEVLYVCNYCKPLIKKKQMPPRCVLNGLQIVPIPPELADLDSLSRQLIQRAKCYQTVVRLGTYTAKVPIYNSLKACKGTMFFLPLPLNKTLETLDQVKQSGDTALPDPELYIIVNGRPTKSKVVWRSLVDVNRVKAAIQKLKESNWLYKEVDDDSVDEAAKKVIEVTNGTTSTMLEKATDDDIAGFQAFTIRNLDNKLSTASDTEQYKVLGVTEDPIDNRQQHLDVMCFPVLFPTGKFGEFHPREKKSLTVST